MKVGDRVQFERNPCGTWEGTVSKLLNRKGKPPEALVLYRRGTGSLAETRVEISRLTPLDTRPGV